MEFICRRCNRMAKEKLYRVTAEEAGVVLLNMLVCASCARLASRLGLRTMKMESAEASRGDESHEITTGRKQKDTTPTTCAMSQEMSRHARRDV